MELNLPKWPGWHLIGRFPEGGPDGVGSWLLHHGGDALLLEVPPGLTAGRVTQVLSETRTRLKFIAASHDHEDHLHPGAWKNILHKFPAAMPLHSKKMQEFKIHDNCALLGAEPVWFVNAPKHSPSDVVTVFRGVAMTGDIELGTLESVNDEVPLPVKEQSMKWLAEFCDRHNYWVHSVVSAHLNDVRTDLDGRGWKSLFSVELVPAGVRYG